MENHSKMQLSEIIWGSMRIFDAQEFHDPKKLADFLSILISKGVSSWDTADIYGSYAVEEQLGKAIALLPQDRDHYQVITKCGIQMISKNRPENHIHHYNTRANYIMSSAEESLKKLQLDTLDVYLIHRPDYLADADEIALALDKLCASGKVKSIGVSNYMPSQWDLLQSRLKNRLFTNQVEFSPLYLDPIFNGMFDQAQQHRARPMVWSPFAGGRIFDNNHRKLQQVLSEIGKKYAVNESAVITSWVMQHPSKPMPIIGSNKMSRIDDAIAGSKITLDIQDWYKITEVAANQEVP